jgi:hypothetical protein
LYLLVLYLLVSSYADTLASLFETMSLLVAFFNAWQS